MYLWELYTYKYKYNKNNKWEFLDCGVKNMSSEKNFKKNGMEKLPGKGGKSPGRFYPRLYFM